MARKYPVMQGRDFRDPTERNKEKEGSRGKERGMRQRGNG